MIKPKWHWYLPLSKLLLKKEKEIVGILTRRVIFLRNSYQLIVCPRMNTSALQWTLNLGGYWTTSLLMPMVVQFLGQSPPALEPPEGTSLLIKECLNGEDYKKMKFLQHVCHSSLSSSHFIALFEWWVWFRYYYYSIEGQFSGVDIVKFVHRKALKELVFLSDLQNHTFPSLVHVKIGD